MKVVVLLAVCLLFGGLAFAQEPEQLPLMPYPASLTIKEGTHQISKDFRIALEGATTARLQAAADRFLRRLDERSGQFFTQEHAAEKGTEAASLLIKVQREGQLQLHEDESYTLTVGGDQMLLQAQTDIGALRGLQTLLQLVQANAEGYYFPAVVIEDKPRFPWRGLLIDVARHFQPVEVIKRNLDGLAAVKMNVLHLHLTDDQGFRIESKAYPQFHQKASEGQYYTQEQMREIIRYAADRGIRVVPEFDVPGHATSWLVAFPEIGSAPGPYTLENGAGIFDPTLDPANEKTYEILNTFFAEMAELFPDPYFHIGGDENEGRHWEANPRIQAFMKKKKIADKHALQTYFNKRIMSGLEKRGKQVIGWDEILVEGLPKTAVIQSWRGHEGLRTAAKQGYATLLSNGYYIDLMHPAKDHYRNDPLPEGHGLTQEEQKRVLGGEATMWSELVTPLTIDSRIWPRTAAIAERLWSPREVRNEKDMYQRLEQISLHLERLGLQHLRNQEVILRNLAGGRNIEPLQTLVAVAEPMKGYTRNPNGTMFKMYSPYTLFADATTADAPAARRFNGLVEQYLHKGDDGSRTEIVQWLEKWKANHALMQPLFAESPALQEIEALSQNLSVIAGLGLEAVQEGAARNSLQQFNLTHALQQLEKARAQGGRTELQVVDAIEKLVKASAAAAASKK